MPIAYDDKDRVKQATDMVDLASQYLQLQRRGSIYVALCPWHQDNRPSLQVNPSRQSWKCWVCDIGGDVFDFVMKRENVDFREALEMLAERAGIELTHRPKPKTVAGNPNDKPTLYRAMQWATSQYHHCLLNDSAAEPARRYLAARGINDSAIQQFQIGFAPEPWSWLLDRARSTEFSSEVLQACGLVVQSNRTKGFYDRFRGRLMFPIHDTQDRAIAFGGRILPELAEAESESGHHIAKYINSPETKLYAKSDQLFGLNIARRSMTQDRHLIIVEGYTDVIGAWIAGIENVAAVCGTSLNRRHIQVIKRFADRITLVLDGDEAGQKRTNEILEYFVNADVDLRITILPDGSDPCDFVQQKGANEFRSLIDTAQDALDHKIAVETANIDLIRDTHRANQALDNILHTIANSPTGVQTTSANRVKHQQILTRLTHQFQVDLDSILHRLSELRRRKHPSRSGTATTGSDAGAPVIPLECELLQLLLQDGALIDPAVENISPTQFVEGPCREIYEMICQCYHEGKATGLDSLLLDLESAAVKHLLLKLDEESKAKFAMSDTELTERLNQVIVAFEQMTHETERRQALSELNRPEIEIQEESEILEQLLQKTRERQGIQ